MSVFIRRADRKDRTESMDIDQRLDRLTDRHEALTQSVELLVAEGREVGKRLDAVGKRLDGVGKRVDKLAASVDSLVNVIREHERRIHRLEGGEDA